MPATTLADAAPRQRRSPDAATTEPRRSAQAHPTPRRRLTDAVATVEAHLPILASAGVAFAGQMSFAATVLHWSFPGQVLYAAGVETLSYSMARLWSRMRRQGHHARLALTVTWVYALYAGGTNYWHHSPSWAPSPTAIAFGMLSVAGIATYLVHERYRIRQHHRDRHQATTVTEAPSPTVTSGSAASLSAPSAPSPRAPWGEMVVTVYPNSASAPLTLPAIENDGPSQPPTLDLTSDDASDAGLTATEQARRWLDQQREAGRDLRTIKSTEVRRVSGLKSHAREVLRRYKAEYGIDDESSETAA